MKINDFVVLTEKARKQFYETEAHLHMYDSPKIGDWDNQSLVSFTNSWVGFESGERAGLITRVNEEHNNAHVRFFGPLGWEVGCYEIKHLSVVGSV